MKKSFFRYALFAALFMHSAHAADVHFMVAEHDFAYHANGDVVMKLYSADWSKEAIVIFRRGELPEDRVSFDASTGMVTLFYSIDELPGVRALVLESNTVAFNYMDDGVSEAGYLYTNP